MRRILIATGISLWGLYLRFHYLAHRDWWTDECNQWNATLGALKPFWQRLPNGELTCFPGDYLLTYPFVQIFQHNKWGVAIPHIIVTLVGFYFLYLICQRYLKTTWATAIAFIAYSLNFELIFHAFELRPYAVLSTLGLMIFYCTETLISSKYRITPMKKFFIGILFFLSILYHTYGILIVGFCAIFSIFNELDNSSWQTILKRISKFYIIVGIISLPIWFWYASYNIGQDVTKMPTFDYIPNPLIHPFGFLKAIVGNLINPKYLHFLLAGPLLAFIFAPKSRMKYLGFFLTLIVLPISLLCVMDASMNYWFLQRQFVWVISLFSFFIAWGGELAWIESGAAFIKRVCR